MADDRRRRFSQIERPRAPGEAPDATPGTGSRFGALEDRDAPAGRPAPAHPAAPGLPGPPGEDGAPVARGHTDRFRPPADRPLEVDDRAEASQPFVRCCRCETDSSRFAARCSTCGEPLDTDAQRAFNERLWAERRAQAGAEEAERVERQAVLDRAQAEAAAARRLAAEEMAREVGLRERRRLEGDASGEPVLGPPGGGWEGGEGWGRDGSSAPGGGLFTPGLPLGFRLLGLLPPGWRVAAGVGAVGLAALLFLGYPAAGLVAGVVLLGLFTPGRWRRRSWW